MTYSPTPLGLVRLKGSGSKRDRELYDIEVAAAQCITPVVCCSNSGFEADPDFEDGNCLVHAVLTHRELSEDDSGWRVEAGMVVGYNKGRGKWDAIYELGHAWLWNQERGWLLDVTALGRGSSFLSPQLVMCPSIHISALPSDYFASGLYGRATPELLPHLDNLKGCKSVDGLYLIYLPGVSAVDYIKHRKDMEADEKEVISTELYLFGYLWPELCDATRDQGCCADLATRLLRLSGKAPRRWGSWCLNKEGVLKLLPRGIGTRECYEVDLTKIDSHQDLVDRIFHLSGENFGRTRFEDCVRALRDVFREAPGLQTFTGKELVEKYLAQGEQQQP